MREGDCLLPCDCIVPAAGLSSRMGVWKLLLPFAGSTIAERVVGRALAACLRVIVVVGYRRQALARCITPLERTFVVEHRHYRLGMFSSIQAGCRFVKGDCCFVTPADMPLIEPEHYRLVASGREGDMVRPTFEGRLGHPVLLNRIALAKVLEASPDDTMHSVLGAVRKEYLPVDDVRVCFDVDTPERYRHLSRLGGATGGGPFMPA